MPESLLAPGHTACLGCGELLGARLAVDAVGPNCIIVNATGCLEVCTSKWPQSAWRVPWIHSLFDNTAAVAAGIEAALRAQGKKEGITVIAQGGDGGMADIGFGPISGMWERGHHVLTMIFDNEAYMNTGIQRSGLTPVGARTSTSPPGKFSLGNPRPKKDMVQIAVAHGLPYVASASSAYARDLQSKVKKAIAVQGPTLLHVHTPCPLGWGYSAAETITIGELAVKTGLFPVVEIENGKVTKVMSFRQKTPVEEYLKPQVRFRHLFSGDGDPAQIARIQAIADENIARYGLLRES